MDRKPGLSNGLWFSIAIVLCTYVLVIVAAWAFGWWSGSVQGR